MNDLSGVIIGSALRIHTKLGPGLLESVYESVLARDLERLGHGVERQKPVQIHFEGMVIENAFRADLLIDEQIIVEIKSIQAIAKVHEKQVLTYLRLMDLRLGLILNFGTASLKEGIKRIANRADPLRTPRPPREIKTPEKSK